MHIDRKFYVYGIFDPQKETPFYIGKGSGGRIKNHLGIYLLRTDKTLKTKLIKKILKRGEEPILKKLFIQLSEEEAFQKEKDLIKLYGRIDQNTGCLANHTDGGEGISGYSFPKDTFEERSARFKGIPRSEEVKRKISENRKGIFHTEETKRKISLKKKGVCSEKQLEINRQIAKKRIGKKLNQETKDKISKAHKGRVVPKERREKISATLKKEYKIVDPNGLIIIISDIKKFCQDMGFGASGRNCLASLSQRGYYCFCARGIKYKYFNYKGYTSLIKP